jgi:hypothetical protein
MFDCGTENMRVLKAETEQTYILGIQRSSQTSAHWKWHDKGSGAHSDFSCWNPGGDHMVASIPHSVYYDKVYGYTFSGYGMDYPATYQLVG